METIKNSLKHDYNLAVDSFNRKDYVSFFRNIRPAIEWLCKLIIYDVLDNQAQSEDIIEGRKTISKSLDVFSLTSPTSRRAPTGSAFAILFQKVYYYKHPEVFSSREDKMKLKIRKGMDSASFSLNNWYSIASEIGSHSGGASLDEETQARSCAASLPSIFDFFRVNGILSRESIEFLAKLQKFSYSPVREKELSQAQRQIKEAEELLRASNEKISEKEATLLLMQKQLAEQEKKQLESQERTKEVEKELLDKDEEIEALKAQIAAMHIEEPKEIDVPEPVLMTPAGREPRIRRNSLLERLAITEWDVEEESMDDDQLDLIDETIDKSLLVAGCAGSGKSVIAMHKAKQISDEGFSVILIAYTKSLNSFMQTGNNEGGNYQFYYHYQWKDKHMPSADYIIVDEIQDFDKEEIEEFINAAKKHFLFFGDTAQSIYRQFGKNTMTIEEISKLTNLPILPLYNNYRLPRPVAKITQNYVGVNVSRYADKIYRNKEKALPHFVQFPDFTSQVQAIAEIVNNNPDSSVGILLPNNKLVIDTYRELLRLNVSFEYKFQVEGIEKKTMENLDFYSNLPKLMTYHSAKGLQFDIVILPKYDGAKSIEDRKALYVAMTRTMHELYVMYSTSEIKPPLNVPTHLYKKEL